MARALLILLLGQVALAAAKAPRHEAADPGREHRLIVRFADSERGDVGLMERRLRALERREGVLRAKGLPAVAMAVAVLDSPEAEERILEELEADPAVELATPDTWIRFDGVSGSTDGRHAAADSPSQLLPNDTMFSALWGLDSPANQDIDAPEAWKTFTGEASAGIVVAVIDTGIDYNHEDLRDNMWVNPFEIPDNGLDDDGNGFVDDVHGADFLNEDGDPFDDQKHGTHCAGTIAAVGNNGLGVAGISWHGVKLMALKFLGPNGGGRSSDAVQAIDYAVAHGAKIASNSWGSRSSSAAIRAAIERAEAAGMLFIAAAGNAGTNNDLQPHYPSSYPVDNIVAVASTTREGPLSSFSCYGLKSVDVAAPGSGIYSTVPGQGYESLSGTSMATPHVSGLAALVWMYRPDLSMEQVREVLVGSVKHEPVLKDKILTGGRINARQALDATTSMAPPRPPVHPPQRLAFVDTNPRVGAIAGTATITAAADESDVEYYRLYLVSQAGFRLYELGTAPATGLPLIELRLNGSVALPRYTALLVAVAGNATGEMPAKLSGEVPSLAVDDLALPLGQARSAEWKGDLDLRPGMVHGGLALSRAADESQTTSYNIYWANASGVRGPLMGSIPARGFLAPRCAGASCHLISNGSDGFGDSSFERGAYRSGERATITASGPGRLTVTRCHTEYQYDALTVGEIRVSGQPAVPQELQLPRGQVAIEWYSDGSIAGEGWAFELHQDEAEVSFMLATAVPLGRGLEVVPAYGRHELPAGLFVLVADFDAGMPPSPAYAPASLRFEDSDPAAGTIAGAAEVLPAPGAAENGSVTFYRVDFADAAGRPIIEGGTAPANGSSAVPVPLTGPVPAEAVQMLARAGNAFGLGVRGTLAELVDAVPREPVGPGACAWACGGPNASQGSRWGGDMDPRRGIVRGTLRFPRAPNESQITHYGVFWANASARGALLGSLATAGFQAPRCVGISCPLIANASLGPGRTSFERGAYNRREWATLMASGPGMLTVTRFDTERHYDTLLVGGAPLSGRPAVPMQIELPRGQAAISWRSDSSIGSTGWAFELRQDEAEAHFDVAATMSLGHGLEVVPFSGHYELPEALFVPVVDFDVTMPPSPAFTPVGLRFEDLNLAPGAVTGIAEVVPAPGATASGSVAYYQVDFADAAGRPLGVGARAAAADSSSPVQVPLDSPVPAGAVQLLARAGNALGLGAPGPLADLVDDSLEVTPQAARWEGDVDIRAGIVQGTLVLERSADESQTTHYNVYWANASGIRGPLAGRLPTAAFLAPRCSGASCPLIADASRGPGHTAFERGAYSNNERATITASGPGLVTVTRFETRSSRDFLRVSSRSRLTKLSGKPHLPLTFRIPPGSVRIYWHSGGRTAASGWAFELQQDDAEARFQLAAAPLGHGLEVVAASGQKELPLGLFVPVADLHGMAPASPPVMQAVPSLADARLSALSAAPGRSTSVQVLPRKDGTRKVGSGGEGVTTGEPREPWLPSPAVAEQEVVVWPSLRAAALLVGSRSERRVLTSVTLPGVNVRAAASRLAGAIPSTVAASLPFVEERGVRVLRVLAITPAAGSGTGKQSEARVEFEVVPTAGSPEAAADRIEARVILLGRGGAAADRFGRLLAARLAAGGIALPAESRPLVGEPQQLWPRGRGRALAAAPEARRLAKAEPRTAASAVLLGAAAAAALAAAAAALAPAARCRRSGHAAAKGWLEP